MQPTYSSAGKQSVGHPVDVATGVMFGEFPDAFLPGRMPLVWKRFYSTALLSAPAALIGPGWRLPFLATLRVETGHAIFSPPFGLEEVFDDPAGQLAQGETLRHLGSFTEVAREGDRFVVRTWSSGDLAGGTRYVFSKGLGEALRLECIESADGEGIDLIYDIADRPTEMRQRREGRGVRLAYNDRGRVETVIATTRSGSGNLVMARYRYDGADRLAEALDALGHSARYEYDDASRLIRETPRGAGAYTFKYDHHGRCMLTVGPDGYARRALRYNDASRFTQVSDTRGAIWTYECLVTGQVVAETTPLGLRTLTEYDEHGRISALTSPAGEVRRFEYDPAGNRAAIYDALGRVTRFAYNSRRQLTTLTTKDGGVWRRGYDSHGRITSSENAAQEAWQFSRNERGDVVQIRDPVGGIARLTYDESGRLTSRIDRRGNRTEFSEDEFGRITHCTDPLGSKTTFAYSSLSQLLRAEWPNGTTTENRYDAAGRLTQTIGPGGRIWEYTYGVCGRETSIVEPGRQTVEYLWGSEVDELTGVRNEKGEEFRIEYDPDGRVVRMIDFAGRDRSNEYDPAGRLTATTIAGETTHYKWDRSGTLSSLTLADGSSVTFECDPMGRVVAAENRFCKIQFVRDPLGRITQELRDGHSVSSTFNLLGDRSHQVTSQGGRTRYDYDADQNLRALTLSDGAQIQFVADERNREVARYFPNATQLQQSFDVLGRLVRQRLVTGSPNSARTPAIEFPTILDRTYEYRADGNLVRIGDDRWGRIEYEYEAGGRLLSVRRELGPSEQFQYDPGGNIISSMLSTGPMVEQNRPDSGPVSGGSQQSREIGLGNKLLRAGPKRFEYDGQGRMVKRTEEVPGKEPRVWEYQWDALGQLIGIVNPAGEQWRYEYDPFGRRIAKHGPAGSTSYIWDRDTIAQELPPKGGVVTWTFLPGGFRPVSRQADDRTHYVITDHLATPRELVDERGAVAWAGVFTAWGEFHRSTGREADPGLRFPGQWYDSESGLHYNRFRYYCPDLGMYLSPDPLGIVPSLNQYSYAPNPILWADPFGLGVQEYGPLDPNNGNRPTGAYAEVAPADLGTGSEAGRQQIAGFEGGAHPDHHERGHLIANQLGGSGTDVRNLATMTSGTNCGPGGMIHAENAIAAHVAAGNTVAMIVIPNYHGDACVAHSFTVIATDQNGKVIVDTEVENGKYKNHTG